MWPWNGAPDIRTLLEHPPCGTSTSHNASFTLSKSENDQGVIKQGDIGDGINLLPCRGPGFCDDEKASNMDGSFSAPADLAVDEELLCAAAGAVKWLVIRFVSYPQKPFRHGWKKGLRGNQQFSTGVPAQFPSWVFQLRELKGLSIERYPHSTLPEALCGMEKLEHLHCYGSALRRVPRSIGRLRNLKELDLYTSYDLHYLPIEILSCPNLRTSRFSTRALYANYKNNLPLPPLRPWWYGKDHCAPSFATIRDNLANLDFRKEKSNSGNANASDDRPLLLPTEIVDCFILPLLEWNWCSVCNRQYENSFGCHAWSIQNVATDTQALLAFCCSTRCASRVQNQRWFNPAARANVKLPKGAKCQCALDKTAGTSGPRTQSIPNANLSKHHKNEKMTPCEFEEWSKDHLRPWPLWTLPPIDKDAEGATPVFPHPVRNEPDTTMVVGSRRSKSMADSTAVSAVAEETGASVIQMQTLRVMESGDVRDQPSSVGAQVGRLRVGEVVHPISNFIDSRGRE